jgi:tricorn protease
MDRRQPAQGGSTERRAGGIVWLPDTYAQGLTNFNRYYFAQTGKQGAVIDERFNGGGFLADYFLDYMHCVPLSCATGREGEDTCNSTAGIFGPKAMIINEFAGSGGDALPWCFRKMRVGPLVGKRTWGGLVGIGGYPELIDGGRVTSPRWAIYGLTGEWEVENHGIQPDYDVELDPKAFSQGHDLQLERAVKAVLDQLAATPRRLTSGLRIRTISGSRKLFRAPRSSVAPEVFRQTTCD